MSSLVLSSFNNIKLYTVTINGKPWTRAREIYQAIEYATGRTRDVLKKHVSSENKERRVL